MTKEELKQEAEEKCVCIDKGMRIMYGIGYIDGAEPREKRIAELKAQVEKMKCCSNCMWSDCDGKLGNPPCKDCDFNNNKWELRR